MPRNVNPYRQLTSFVRPFPDFVIIGAMKCGTTTLHHLLREHPDVRAPIRKEIHFFDQNYEKGPAWYRGHFPSVVGKRDWVTGEASPYYLCHPAVPARVAETVPQAKLVAIIRNPVNRAYSHYQQVHAKGWDPLPFEEAMAAEEERLAAERGRMTTEAGYFSEDHRRFSYLERGRYAEQLERWYQHFPREQLLVIATEELGREPERTHAALLEFLGLRPWNLTSVKNHKVQRYDPMTPAARERLSEYFAPYNQRLYELLGRDLGW